MKRAYFVQVNNCIAGATFLPLSIGYIWSYCIAAADISSDWELGGVFFERESADDIISKIHAPDIVGISCYVWNWEISKKVAAEIKIKWPECKIVLGGPQPPYSESWLAENEYIDYIIVHSGEVAFAEILRGKTNIPGVISRDSKFIESTPITNLDIVPSPYLTGFMDSIMDPDKQYSAVIETNRGCPYKCTFCDQESSFYNKIYKFNYNRVMDELDWMSAHKIEFVCFADSNLGIFERDIDFMSRIAVNKQRTGYPKQIDYATAKQQPAQILALGNIMIHTAEIKRGVTIALQSMNTATLLAIKRINVANTKLEQIIQNYNKHGIDNYCELILGLPEETHQSWIDGISTILNIGSDHALTMHPLSVVPNTPFGTTQYKERYGLKYTKTVAPAGGNFYEHELIDEYDWICHASNTMTSDEWIDCYFFTKGIIIPHHYHGVSQVAAEYLHREHNIPLIDYYLLLHEYSKIPGSLLYTEYMLHTDSVRQSLFNKQPWGRKINNGTFYFQDNAATAAFLYSNITSIHAEIADMVYKKWSIDIKEVLKYNMHILNTVDKQCATETFTKNWDNWFTHKGTLKSVNCSISVKLKQFANAEAHAKNLFWFGRKSKRCFLNRSEEA